MKIGEIAERSGVSASIIRYYGCRGVLPPAVRDQHGYRGFGDAELARIAFVTSARKLEEVDDEMERLRQIQAVLSRLHTHELNLLAVEKASEMTEG